MPEAEGTIQFHYDLDPLQGLPATAADTRRWGKP